MSEQLHRRLTDSEKAALIARASLEATLSGRIRSVAGGNEFSFPLPQIAAVKEECASMSSPTNAKSSYTPPLHERAQAVSETIILARSNNVDRVSSSDTTDSVLPLYGQPLPPHTTALQLERAIVSLESRVSLLESTRGNSTDDSGKRAVQAVSALAAQVNEAGFYPLTACSH